MRSLETGGISFRLHGLRFYASLHRWAGVAIDRTRRLQMSNRSLTIMTRMVIFI